MDAEPEPLLSCDGRPFRPSVFEQPAGAEDADDPAAAALRDLIANPRGIEPIPTDGYRVLHRSDRLAQFAVGEPPYLQSVWLDTRDDAWGFAGSGGCAVRPWREDAEAVVWELDPSRPLEAARSSFTALVSENACTGGADPRPRLEEPQIRSTEDAVIVTMFIRPLGAGPDQVFTCIGRPPVPVEVELEEPLGDRLLLDGGLYPPQPPATEPDS